jgi:glycosyltransferase involved in cell wall biosynthesis
MKPGVAFFMYGITSLKGGGGAERFFSDLFLQYKEYDQRRFEPYFIIDEESVSNLREVGKLTKSKGLLGLRIYSNRFKTMLEGAQILKHVLLNRITLIHVPLYNVSYVPLLKFINRIPGIFRPKLAINIVNCYAAPALMDEKNPYHQAMKENYSPLFSEVNVDGYFCWNENFVSYLKENATLTYRPKAVQSITSRFSDVEHYFPEKEKKTWVVFASRLDDQKHPQWFIEAISRLKKNTPELMKEWNFKVCGNGPLRDELIDLTRKNAISQYVEFLIEGEMHKILNHSKIYVSCQDYDNFPSLTMAEAMAAGNAIVARNVGQTSLFVNHTVNGLLIEPDSPEGLEKALSILIADQALTAAMGEKSVRAIKEKHNFRNFVIQIEEFWNSILGANKTDTAAS